MINLLTRMLAALWLWLRARFIAEDGQFMIGGWTLKGWFLSARFGLRFAYRYPPERPLLDYWLALRKDKVRARTLLLTIIGNIARCLHDRFTDRRQLSPATYVLLWLYTRPGVAVMRFCDRLRGWSRRLAWKLAELAIWLHRKPGEFDIPLSIDADHAVYLLLAERDAPDYLNPTIDKPVIRHAALSVGATFGGLAAVIALLVFAGPLVNHLQGLREYMQACLLGVLK